MNEWTAKELARDLANMLAYAMEGGGWTTPIGDIDPAYDDFIRDSAKRLDHPEAHAQLLGLATHLLLESQAVA